LGIINTQVRLDNARYIADDQYPMYCTRTERSSWKNDLEISLVKRP
jgi:hypothetical protein